MNAVGTGDYFAFNNLHRLQEIENEITENLALLGRWSYVYADLPAAQKKFWKEAVLQAQASSDRDTVRAELDSLIHTVLQPVVAKMN